MNINFWLKQNQLTKNSIINCVSCPTHERQESHLCRSNIQIYALRNQQVKDWDTTYAPLPKNYTLLDKNKPIDKQIPTDIDIDVFISQNKFGQYQIIKPMADKYNRPLICIEHTQPTFGANNPQYIAQARKMSGDYNVFITDYSRRLWGYDETNSIVIKHGVDTILFNDQQLKRENTILSVANDWVNRAHILGLDIWKEATQGLPTQVLGNSPGFSEPAKGLDHLIESYNKSLIFLNTSRLSPIPSVLLEAMSCACCCISTINPMIEEVITHNHDGLLCRNTQEMRHYLELCLKNPDLAQRLGQNARKTIQERFNLDTFVEKWNELFYRVVREWR